MEAIKRGEMMEAMTPATDDAAIRRLVGWEQECPSCGGRGKNREVPTCSTCHGSGRVPVISPLRRACPGRFFWTEYGAEPEHDETCCGLLGWLPNLEADTGAIMDALREAGYDLPIGTDVEQSVKLTWVSVGSEPPIRLANSRTALLLAAVLAMAPELASLIGS